jgi:hypothetical protein
MALAALDGVRATMDEISEHPWIISIVGDFLTLFGAYWTARAVILTKQQADEISSVPYGGPHPKHSAALLDQSRAAMIGLVCVAVGAGFQIVSKLIEEFLTG